MTSTTLRSADPSKTKADAVVVGLLASEGSGSTPTVAEGGEKVEAAYGKKWAPLLATLGATGAAGEVVKLPADKLNTPLLVLVGLGSKATTDAVRRGAGAVARSLPNAASVALALPASEAGEIRAVVEGYLLGGYSFDTYRSGDAPSRPGEVVFLSAAARKKDVTTAYEEALATAAAVARVRDWVNTPPGDLTPPVFADQIADAAKTVNGTRGAGNVKVTVHDEAALEKLGCGGTLAVGRASAAPPRLVELSYSPRGAKAKIALVGKGITFDSGGLTIKPGSSMKEMKSDMAGAATVVSAVLTAAALKLPVKVTGHVALAENMVSGAATRPGDVITIYGGTTVEISNTDAEGRLVLADAMGRAAETQPDAMLDVATLTGAMVVALGDQIAGVMGDDAVVADVLSAAEVADEHMWHMPLPEHMTTRVKSSKIADLAQHDWIRWGGGLFAGAFLNQFTRGVPWAHLDIAGPSFASGGPSGHITTGGTGFGTTTLVDYLRASSAK